MGRPGTSIEAASWRAIGTNVDLLVVGGDLEAARRAVEAQLAAVDLAYSRFRSDSELTELNRRAGHTVALSPLLSKAIGEAIRAARLTNGLCDPTVGRALTRIGYDDDFALVAGAGAPIELRIERVPGWRTLAFDPVAGTIRVPRGVELDLGSTGKALAADLAAVAAVEAMERGTRSDARTWPGALVSLGGDIAISGAVPAEGWAIRVTHDSTTPPDAWIAGEDADVIAIREGAVATSSTAVRRWRRGAITVHHLIDPRTGLPARSPWRTVSVVAGTCLDANAAATAALILGEDAPAWLESLGLAARFAAADGPVVRVGGWPAPLEPEGLGEEPQRQELLA